MSGPWWTDPNSSKKGRMRTGQIGTVPAVVDADAAAIAESLLTRRPGFTPDWLPIGDDDAGIALVRLFGEQSALVAQRVNRLPEKTLVELYEAAGILARDPRPAEALVQFTVADSAPHSVLIPRGFQLGATAVDGSGDLVVFETQESVAVGPVRLMGLYAETGSARFALPLPEPGNAIAPFGREPQAGNALLIGLKGERAPTDSLSLGFFLTNDEAVPPPASSGGLNAVPLLPVPTLQWEALGVNGSQPLEVLRDDTQSLTRSGIVQVRLPSRWEASALDKEKKQPAFWLAVRVTDGSYAAPPQLIAIQPNLTRVRAVRTIRDEALLTIPDSQPTRLTLAQRPVVPGSLVLVVDEGVGNPAVPWKEVEDLNQAGPEDRVFLVDYQKGELIFGDGVHGRTVPPGFRNVLARQYQVGRGAASNVGAGAIRTLLNSAPFLIGVTNPWPASGGSDAETLRRVVQSAPRRLQSRGRAVTAGDYAALALSAPGAEVRRAHSIPVRHPAISGRIAPGVVGVWIVPPQGEGPPIPTEATLAAVARHLTETAAVAGVQVVAAPPVYRRIEAEIILQVQATANAGTVLRQVHDAVTSYLHPLTGGEGGDGWPFGQSLRYQALLRRLMQVAGVRSIHKLRLFVNGTPQPACADVPLEDDELFWPGRHNVQAMTEVTP